MSDTQCPGLRSLYHAAKLRQLRAIAADPNSAPARVAQANEEIRKLADSLYRDREVGPTALITRLEREGIEAVERTLAGRTDAPMGGGTDGEPGVDESDVYAALQGLIDGVLEGQANAEEAAGLWAEARSVIARAGGVL